MTGITDHWELIESYYVSHLNQLQKQIEQRSLENSRLTDIRDDLLKQVVRLTERSTELSLKNEQLSRLIAEKENKVTAFMYNQQDHAVLGVTLEDPPAPSIHSSNTSISDSYHKQSGTSKSDIKIKREPGLFRQLSLRLSTRRRRQDDSAKEVSQPEADDAKENHVSEPVLHPAMVVQNEVTTEETRERNSLFGKDLAEQVKIEGSRIPLIVTKCVQEIELRGLTVEGIYRKSGSLQQVKDLQDMMETSQDVNLSECDIAVVASLLKLYLRSLPVPLIPNKMILPCTISPQERLNKTYSLLHGLPNEIYCTTKYIAQHLRRIHDHQSANRMNSKNLAVVFGPTLMRLNDDETENKERQTHEMIDTIEFIILQSHTLFADYYP
ncbi:hypothetical protein G6F70_007418 [Rhizopus microsporus]|nr:hypothetical protein G6F71_005708 [Rhizopus microsporus]KAG1196489.1 hypothetical protein G6F70_007418 [Rhizopus microsporus]KAG1208234.1 hypothetical protein G6F69_007402 [Rhizopus microsporus]KAG1232276.1 hypothetical protein G6F67_005121 [Rhizopus microsporus]KAG1261515.1 hypothetical protein G6F68_006622 [Rhizopus microsporus]